MLAHYIYTLFVQYVDCFVVVELYVEWATTAHFHGIYDIVYGSVISMAYFIRYGTVYDKVPKMYGTFQAKLY